MKCSSMKNLTHLCTFVKNTAKIKLCFCEDGLNFQFMLFQWLHNKFCIRASDAYISVRIISLEAVQRAILLAKIKHIIIGSVPSMYQQTVWAKQGYLLTYICLEGLPG